MRLLGNSCARRGPQEQAVRAVRAVKAPQEGHTLRPSALAQLGLFLPESGVVPRKHEMTGSAVLPDIRQARPEVSEGRWTLRAPS